jgi:hypothetical protein
MARMAPVIDPLHTIPPTTTSKTQTTRNPVRSGTVVGRPNALERTTAVRRETQDRRDVAAPQQVPDPGQATHAKTKSVDPQQNGGCPERHWDAVHARFGAVCLTTSAVHSPRVRRDRLDIQHFALSEQETPSGRVQPRFRRRRSGRLGTR